MTDYDWEMQERKFENDMAAIDLEAENAELRELVRDLVRWYGVEHLPHEELRFWGDKSGGVYARMRKLGIEVES